MLVSTGSRTESLRQCRRWSLDDFSSYSLGFLIATHAFRQKAICSSTFEAFSARWMIARALIII